MGDIKIGLVASILFHGAIILVASVGVPVFDRDFPTPPRPIPVELIDIEELTRQMEPPREEAPEQKTAPARRVAAAKPDNSVPLPDVQPRSKPDADVIKRRTIVAQATPHTKPRPPTSFDSSRIAALIDRSIKEQPQVTQDREKLLEQAVESAKAMDLDSKRRTVSFEDYIRAKMLECWSVPAGAPAGAEMKVVVTFTLNPEGYLMGAPKIKQQSRMFQSGGEYYKIFAESAARAIRRCEPYDQMSREYYQEWQDWELTFNPEEMLG